MRVALLVGVGAWRTAPSRSSRRDRGSLPFTAPALLAGAAGLAILDFERGAPHSRALALGSVLLGAVLFADIFREPEKALAAFVVDKPQFPKTFEATGQTLMIAVLAVFVGLTALAWFESQPRDGRELPPGPRRWVARARRASTRDGARELARIWNGNLRLRRWWWSRRRSSGLGAMIFIGRRGRLGPRRQAVQENFAVRRA